MCQVSMRLAVDSEVDVAEAVVGQGAAATTTAEVIAFTSTALVHVNFII